MESVLLLNYDFTFHAMISMKKALHHIVKDKAFEKFEVVEYSKRVIENTERTWKIVLPKVMRLLKMVKQLYRQCIKFSRRLVFLRDRHRCGYCGRHKSEVRMTIDHVVPKSRGGKTEFINTVVACIDCNSEKGNKTLREFGKLLMIKLYAPSVADLMRIRGSMT